MNRCIYKFKHPLMIGAVSLVLVACASGPTQPKGADKVRSKLVQLQSDSKLASLAPIAIKDAEVAVKAAEERRKDQELRGGPII